MEKSVVIFLIIFFSAISAGNAQELVDISNTGSCEKALDISRFKRFGPTTPPEKEKQTKINNFELPKHTVWYKYTAQKNGILLFDIIPNSQDDNYDFILFKNEDDFCTKYNNGLIKPERINLDPPNREMKSYTGLSFAGNEKAYEKGITVKEGQTFYIALNNLYDNGKGHSIIFKYLKTVQITGSISNTKNDHSINAQITWQNLRNNDIVINVQTDKKGDFSFDAAAGNEENTFPQYELSVYADKFFPEYRVYTTEQINEGNIKPVNFNLQKIKKGYNNESLGIIYFSPNDLNTTKESETVLKRLLKLMEQNPKVEIILEGHTNGIYPSTDVDFQLSLQRADDIKNFLVNNGISPDRIQTKGLGSTQEIYEAPETEEQEGANRRVEIFFVKF